MVVVVVGGLEAGGRRGSRGFGWQLLPPDLVVPEETGWGRALVAGKADAFDGHVQLVFVKWRQRARSQGHDWCRRNL